MLIFVLLLEELYGLNVIKKRVLKGLSETNAALPLCALNFSLK